LHECLVYGACQWFVSDGFLSQSKSRVIFIWLWMLLKGEKLGIWMAVGIWFGDFGLLRMDFLTHTDTFQERFPILISFLRWFIHENFTIWFQNNLVSSWNWKFGGKFCCFMMSQVQTKLCILDPFSLFYLASSMAIIAFVSNGLIQKMMSFQISSDLFKN